MAEITSLEQCFNVARVDGFIADLDDLNGQFNDIIKMADESKFGENTCKIGGITLTPKIEKANEKTGGIVKKVDNLKQLIKEKAIEQRKDDLNSYIAYLEGKISKIEAEIATKKRILKENYANINTEADFGVRTRFNSKRITEWKSSNIFVSNKEKELNDLQVKLEIANEEFSKIVEHYKQYMYIGGGQYMYTGGADNGK